jgi:hypothetical protein
MYRYLIRFLVLFSFSVEAIANQIEVPSSLEGFERYGIFQFYPSTPHTIYLLEEILPNQAIDFRQALNEHDIKTLVLASPGGSVETGLLVADKVNDKGISTYIADSQICASACSYIFLAGKNRIAGSNSQLGVHQFAPARSAKKDAGEVYQRAQSLMADVHGIVTSFGIPSIVVTKMLSTPPDEMYFFRPKQMAEIERGEMDQAYLEKIQGLLNDRFLFLSSLNNDIQTNSTPTVKKTKERTEVVSPVIIKTIQKKLNAIGCDAGYPDGVLGPATLNAIRQYEVHTEKQFNLDFQKLLVALQQHSTAVCKRMQTDKIPDSARYELTENCTNILPSLTIQGDLTLSKWKETDREITYKGLLFDGSNFWRGTVSTEINGSDRWSLNLAPDNENSNRKELDYIGFYSKDSLDGKATRGLCSIKISNIKKSNVSVLGMVQSPTKWGVVPLRRSLIGQWSYSEECLGGHKLESRLFISNTNEVDGQNIVRYKVRTEIVSSQNPKPFYHDGTLTEYYNGSIALEFFPTTFVRTAMLNNSRDWARDSNFSDGGCHRTFKKM